MVARTVSISAFERFFREAARLDVDKASASGIAELGLAVAFGH
jgi:hypothetical protein